MKNEKCVHCDNNSFRVLNTYKHHWVICEICQNVYREIKKNLPLDFMKFISKFMSKSLRKLLWHETEVEINPHAFYDYYESVVQKNVENTKWKGQLSILEKKFSYYKLILQGPLLDISGGPGFLAKELDKKNIRTVTTEFSVKAVDKMRKILGINCVVYDYNTHLLSKQVTKEKFNTILIRSSINFCKDLGSFCQDLSTIVEKKGIVYVDFVLPTLGACLRWQHDEYTYEHLLHPHTVEKYFEKAGFRLLHIKLDNPCHAFENKLVGFGKNHNYFKTLIKSIFTLLFTFPYYFKSIFNQPINRSLYQRSVEYFFEKV